MELRDDTAPDTDPGDGPGTDSQVAGPSRDEVFAHGAISVRGAREHNLRDVDVELPRERLVVISGLSGSGKSTLAFDTIFAEGQRRYVESLSAYARQFLGQMHKPDVDAVEGLSPAIAIDQRSTGTNPRSTVGTVTEVWDYLRLLWARVGRQTCAHCDWPGELVEASVDQMVDHVLDHAPDGARLMVMAPVVDGRKGAHVAELARLADKGFLRVRVDGEVVDLEGLEVDPRRKHRIEVVVDRLAVRDGVEARLTESIELALTTGIGGQVVVSGLDEDDLVMSSGRTCPRCATSYQALEPRDFSFNSPYGACGTCDGLGVTLDVDLDACVSEPGRTLRQGAVTPFNTSLSGKWAQRCLVAVGDASGVDLDTPFDQLGAAARRFVVEGSDLQVTGRHRQGGEYRARFEGLRPWVLRRHKDSGDAGRERLGRLLREVPCPDCHGDRLRPESLAVRVGGRSVAELARCPVSEARAFFSDLELDERELAVAGRVVREIRERLGFLDDVGLSYLSLHRSARTLSGGEAQRIRLASQVGSGLVGVLYVLDEPSIGLHPRDNDRLLASLVRLRDLGNTVLVVEHDLETIEAADWVVDVGPGAGPHGGRVVAEGTPAQVAADPASLTGAYLSGRKEIEVPGKRRKGSGRKLVVRGATEHNLDNVTVTVPLGKLVCVTGVSGSGKSTLVGDILEPALARALNGASRSPGAHRRVDGIEHLDKVVSIDQSPIGRTPRSNAATYIGVFDKVRSLYASTEHARTRGWKPGRFSFNVPAHGGGGRCEACSGEGQIRIEMHFLPDVWVPCEVCDGRRYGNDTLDARYRGKSVADVLDTTVTDALDLFADQPGILRQIQTLADVGLGYLTLGQPATTLSGGEAQRVKLASELQRRSTGRTMYILDEPTTGLHFEDVAKLLSVLERLVDAGNTVLVIEHNLDVVKRADWVVDLGPEGGTGGGNVVVAGTPEQVAACEASYTGRALRAVLHLDDEDGAGDGTGDGEDPAPGAAAG